jgi:hypothetical protein
MGVITMHHEGRVYVARCFGSESRNPKTKNKISAGTCMLPIDLVGRDVPDARVGDQYVVGEESMDARNETTDILFVGHMDLLRIQRFGGGQGYVGDLFKVTEIREVGQNLRP